MYTFHFGKSARLHTSPARSADRVAAQSSSCSNLRSTPHRNEDRHAHHSLIPCHTRTLPLFSIQPRASSVGSRKEIRAFCCSHPPSLPFRTYGGRIPVDGGHHVLPPQKNENGPGESAMPMAYISISVSLSTLKSRTTA